MRHPYFLLAFLCFCVFTVLTDAQERYKILFLNMSPVEIAGRECNVNDCFDIDEKIVWKNEKQVMKVLSLSSQKQSVIAAREFSGGRHKTLSSYLVQTKRLSTREGASLPLPQLKEYLSDTFYLIDSIKVKTLLPVNESHFFYAGYEYAGEFIYKKLSSTDNDFIIDYSLFIIDGVPVRPFETPLSVYYMDNEKGESMLITDQLLLIPAVL